MKIATELCEEEQIELIREIMPEFEVDCIEKESSSDAEILLFLHWKKVREYLKHMKNFKLLQALTAGVDHIPLEEIPKYAYLCSNSGANSWAVAEHALALIFSAMKRIVIRDRMMRNGEFPQLMESKLLRGKNVAIIGFGHIGQDLARMLSPFNTRIYAVNRSGKYNGDINVEKVLKISDLDSILPTIDIMVLTLPLTPQTEGLINWDKLEKMKKDAILVNVSRGKIIDERELYEFLKSNPRFTAALDVWWKYGKEFSQDYPFEKLENVIMTPHCGGVYENWFMDSLLHARKNIMRFARGEKLENVMKSQE